MKKHKIIVSGSRTITDYETVKLCIESGLDFLGICEDLEIVSGMCKSIKTKTCILPGKSVDLLAVEWAKEYNIPVYEFPANWEKYGKSAGFKRNEEMAKYGDALISIWDGKSNGSEHMIEMAEQYNLPLIYFMIDMEMQFGII